MFACVFVEMECVCVALHVKQDKRGCIFEISVCDFMFVFYFFLLNALPRLRYGFDLLCANVPAMESSPHLHT